METNGPNISGGVSPREHCLIGQGHLDTLDLRRRVSPSVVQDVAVCLWPKSVDTVRVSGVVKSGDINYVCYRSCELINQRILVDFSLFCFFFFFASLEFLN